MSVIQQHGHMPIDTTIKGPRSLTVLAQYVYTTGAYNFPL